jgi:hypothetical protein
MIIEHYPRGAKIREYITIERQFFENQRQREGYKIQLEPPSALFVDKVDVTVKGIEHEEDPLKATVVTEVIPHWTPEALQTMQALDGLKVNYHEWARSGGPFHQYPNKRLAKWSMATRALEVDAITLWQQPWWKELGQPKMQDLMTLYYQKTLENLEHALQEPQLIVGDKPPNTGTGWAHPVGTRQAMADNIRKIEGAARVVIDDYYHGMQQAIEHWPDEDTVIYLSGYYAGDDRFAYKGIYAGRRSDVDVVEWTKDRQILASKTREVGNDPWSVFHNRQLTNREWQDLVWNKMATPIHMPIRNVDSYIEVRSIPPCTIPGEPDDIVVLSVDAGYRDGTDQMSDRQFIPGKETIAFGADNISLSGIFVKAMRTRYIAMLKSGSPFTMMHYNVMFGNAIYWYQQKLGLHIKLLQIGDDIHMILPRYEVPVIMGALGHWLRPKGMEGDSTFILGHQMVHRGANITDYVVPRAIKSVTSAIGAGLVLPEPEFGKMYTLEVSAEAKEQVAQLRKLYPELIYFNGPRDMYKSVMMQKLGMGSIELAKAGISEWVLDVMEQRAPEQSITQPPIIQATVTQPETTTIQAAPVVTQPNPVTSIESKPKEAQIPVTPVPELTKVEREKVDDKNVTDKDPKEPQT